MFRIKRQHWDDRMAWAWKDGQYTGVKELAETYRTMDAAIRARDALRAAWQNVTDEPVQFAIEKVPE